MYEVGGQFARWGVAATSRWLYLISSVTGHMGESKPTILTRLVNR